MLLLKILFRPRNFYINSFLVFLSIFSTYTFYCFSKQSSIFNVFVLKNFLVFYSPLYLSGLYSIFLFFKLKKTSLIPFYIFIVLSSILHFGFSLIAQNHFLFFYSLFLIVFLYYSYEFNSFEYNKKFYRINDLKDGKIEDNLEISIYKNEKDIGKLVMCDEYGGLLSFSDHLTKPLEYINIRIRKENFLTQIQMIAFCETSNLYSFRFLASKKNQDTLSLINKLQRFGLI